jgi:hypothetical protein
MDRKSMCNDGKEIQQMGNNKKGAANAPPFG